jgi:hypothetical protein
MTSGPRLSAPSGWFSVEQAEPWAEAGCGPSVSSGPAQLGLGIGFFVFIYFTDLMLDSKIHNS